VGSPFGVNKRPNWGPLANDPLAKCLGNSYQQADPKMSSDSSLLRVILISHCLGNTEKKKSHHFFVDGCLAGDFPSFAYVTGFESSNFRDGSIFPESTLAANKGQTICLAKS